MAFFACKPNCHAATSSGDGTATNTARLDGNPPGTERNLASIAHHLRVLLCYTNGLGSEAKANPEHVPQPLRVSCLPCGFARLRQLEDLPVAANTMSNTFVSRKSGNAIILDITSDHMSEFDFQDDVRKDLLSVVEPGTPIQLVINLSNIHMIGSHAIGVLIELHKAVDGAGGKLTLFGVAPNVKLTLQALNLLGRVLEVHDSEQSALQALQ